MFQQQQPTWRDTAIRMGAAAWAQFVKERVSFGRAMPIGALDSLARLCVRRSLLIAQETGITHIIDERVQRLTAAKARAGLVGNTAEMSADWCCSNCWAKLSAAGAFGVRPAGVQPVGHAVERRALCEDTCL